MGIIAWIIFGALSGWVFALIMQSDKDQGVLKSTVIGSLGAVIGGIFAQGLGAKDVSGFTFYSLFVAILGSILLLLIFKAFHNNKV